MRRSTLLVIIAGAALLLPGGTAAQNPRLIASVGPGFEISLTDANGRRVTQLDPGTYQITVNDRSDFHNFHLSGAGVNELTAVEFVGETSWTVTFGNGTYRFVCDPHATQMRGSFLVGNAPAPPPAPARTKLNASVGPGFTISLRTPAGRRVVSTKAGLYDIAVRDRSSLHNFHLTGAGVNRKTGVAFSGTTTWRGLRLQPGRTYTFVCDPHRRQMKGSFRTGR